MVFFFGVSETFWIGVTAVATAALALATAAFVFFAFRQLVLLRESQEDSRISSESAAKAAAASQGMLELSRKATEHQSLIGAFPVVLVGLEPADSGVVLRVTNRGSTPALDVDVQIWITYFEDELPLETFVDRFVPDESKKNVLDRAPTQLDGEPAYALVARLMYTAVPAQTEVEVHLGTPTVPDSVNILLQVRDVLGRNYGRLDWLHRGDGSEDRYRLAGDTLNQITHCPRIGIDLAREANAPSSDRDLEIPDSLIETLNRNLGSLAGHSIALGIVSGEYFFEDPGVWRQL